MAPVLKRTREQRRQRTLVRHERRMAFLQTHDNEQRHRQEVNELLARVRMLRSFRQRMEQKCKLLEQEYELVQGLRDMAETVDTMEQDANEMWHDQEIDDWKYHQNGEHAGREDGACPGCEFMDEPQGGQQPQGHVRGFARDQEAELPPAYVQRTPPADDMLRQTRSSDRRAVAGPAFEPTFKVEAGSALDERDDHSAYVKTEDMTEHDMLMGEESGGAAKRRRSRRRKARAAHPRPYYVPGSVEDE
ncbi:hypothetical protein CERZMDRAFT_108034 [Cercospora zeae-maydis SCOH1-5]|uniref:Uncharacterized protein n=1 Tax=Cercospora zeae-maydis SCOH1-5 TaxID=717836 RepID=A0A6A6EZY2_9PEZI|nr:hypothetical protein CERZMDRAFT_108034 [Cercospora zeae-maydis SCOH1-5]